MTVYTQGVSADLAAAAADAANLAAQGWALTRVDTHPAGPPGVVMWFTQDFLPFPATGATAGSPGSFTPAGATVPANPAGLAGVVASPATAWTAGQYVVLGDGTEAYWTGAVWAPGRAPLPPPTFTSIAPNQGALGGGTPVVVTGANLTGSTALVLGGTVSTGFAVANATTINAVTPAGGALGPVVVTILNPRGNSNTPNGFSYV